MSETTSSNLLQSFSNGLQGFGAGIILVLLSLLGIQIGGAYYGLSFIPVAAILFWPTKASRSWSLIFIFLVGLLQDLMSYGPIGMRAFTYLSVFIIIGEGFKGAKNFTSWLSGFMFVVFLAVTVIIVLGRLVFGEWPYWIPILCDTIASLFIFPLIYWVYTLIGALRSEPVKREIR